VQDRLATGSDPRRGFAGGQFLDMGKVAFRAEALAVEGVTIFEGVECIARSVPNRR